MLDILSYASGMGVRVLGPGTAGVISPGKCKLGAHPARMFTEGKVGVVSKSGALSYEVGKTLTDAGIGQSTVVALGGGPIWGTTQRDIVKLFNEDPETEIIVLLGEIGGGTEIAAAEYIAESVRKPVVSRSWAGRHRRVNPWVTRERSSWKQGNCGVENGSPGKAGASLATSPAQVVELIRKLG